MFHHNQAQYGSSQKQRQELTCCGWFHLLLLFVFKNTLNNLMVVRNTLNGDFQDQNRRRRSKKASYWRTILGGLSRLWCSHTTGWQLTRAPQKSKTMSACSWVFSIELPKKVIRGLLWLEDMLGVHCASYREWKRVSLHIYNPHTNPASWLKQNFCSLFLRKNYPEGPCGPARPAPVPVHSWIEWYRFQKMLIEIIWFKAVALWGASQAKSSQLPEEPRDRNQVGWRMPHKHLHCPHQHHHQPKIFISTFPFSTWST